ncbi:MAG: hypothetical protein V4594_16665 [Bacteroidota bacterium]
MATTTTSVVLVKANERPVLPALLPSTIVVVSDAAGKLYQTTAATVQLVLPVIKNADFAIALKAGQCLEYICLDNDNSMDILIGTAPGANDILSFINGDSITTGQPIAIMRYAKTDEIIYLTGVLAGTKVKIKIA